MEKRHNYAAAGFLLLGIGAAGRAFLGVPEGVTMAELSLTVLLVIGALLLTRQGLAALVCGLAATALELVLCGSWVQAGGALAAAAPFFRLADLWLLLGLVWGSLPAARRAVDDLKYTRSTRMMLGLPAGCCWLPTRCCALPALPRLPACRWARLLPAALWYFRYCCCGTPC